MAQGSFANDPPTRTTDRPTAEAMLDLVDYLIEYLYTSPETIGELNRWVQQLDQEQDGDGPEAGA